MLKIYSSLYTWFVVCFNEMRRTTSREVVSLNSMNQLQAQQEVRASREDEARRLKLEEETSADMALLRAILDAEHRAREVEEAAQQRRTGLEERIQGRKDELLEQIRQETRAAIAADAAAEHQRADAEIAAEQAESFSLLADWRWPALQQAHFQCQEMRLLHPKAGSGCFSG